MAEYLHTFSWVVDAENGMVMSSRKRVEVGGTGAPAVLKPLFKWGSGWGYLNISYQLNFRLNISYQLKIWPNISYQLKFAIIS